MNDLIDYAAVRAVLEEIVSEQPTQVTLRTPCPQCDSPGCRYLDAEGEPSCLIGVYLDRIGVERDVLRAMDTEHSGCSTSFSRSENAIRGWFTVQATSLLSRAQIHQDRGKTWREALEDALAVTSPEES